MSEPITQHEVESEILRLSRLAEKVTQELAKRAQAAAEADASYKVAHAKAYLVAEGTVGEREAAAALATDAEYLKKRTTEALQQSASEAGRNYRAQLDALRSVNSNLRAVVTG